MGALDKVHVVVMAWPFVVRTTTFAWLLLLLLLLLWWRRRFPHVTLDLLGSFRRVHNLLELGIHYLLSCVTLDSVVNTSSIPRVVEQKSIESRDDFESIPLGTPLPPAGFYKRTFGWR